LEAYIGTEYRRNHLFLIGICRMKHFDTHPSNPSRQDYIKQKIIIAMRNIRFHVFTALLVILAPWQQQSFADVSVSGSVSVTFSNSSASLSDSFPTPSYPERNDSKELSRIALATGAIALSAESIESFLEELGIKKEATLFTRTYLEPQLQPVYGNDSKYMRAIYTGADIPIHNGLSTQIHAQYKGSDDAVRHNWEAHLTKEILDEKLWLSLGYGQEKGDYFPESHLEKDLHSKHAGLIFSEPGFMKLKAQYSYGKGMRDFIDLELDSGGQSFDLLETRFVDVWTIIFPEKYKDKKKTFELSFYPLDSLTVRTKFEKLSYTIDGYGTYRILGCAPYGYIYDCTIPDGTPMDHYSNSFIKRSHGIDFYTTPNTKLSFTAIKNDGYQSNLYASEFSTSDSRYNLGFQYDSKQNFLGASIRINFGKKKSLLERDRQAIFN
jgi:hypothetical protein